MKPWKGTYFCTCKEGYSGWAYDKTPGGGCVKNKCSNVQYGDGVNCFLIPKHGECDGTACEDFKCVEGYQKSGPNCENINECGDGTHDCDTAEKARCEDVHPIPGTKGTIYNGSQMILIRLYIELRLALSLRVSL